MDQEQDGRRRILIVDDDVDGLRLLGGMLGDLAQVLFATDGAAGLKMAEAQQPHLILLDVEMPGMSGYEACRRLADEPRTRDIPVIMVTAHAGADSEIAALDAGAVDYISKPYNPPVVRARVRTQLRLQEQAATLARLATVDGLTEIYNRRYFDLQLASEFLRHQRQRQPLSLAIVDIDHFKAYNDGYGHLAGDACLREVARGIRGATQRPGETVARYGGEEFAVILPYTDAEAADKYGQWLCAAVRNLKLPHAHSPVAPFITLSIGLGTCVPGPEYSPTDLINLADRALYAAKAGGRNRAIHASCAEHG